MTKYSNLVNKIHIKFCANELKSYWDLIQAKWSRHFNLIVGIIMFTAEDSVTFTCSDNFSCITTGFLSQRKLI